MIPLILSLALSVEVPVHYLPESTFTRLNDGKIVRVFDFVAYKKLLDIDNRLWTTELELKSYKRIHSSRTELLRRKDETIKSLEVSNSMLSRRADRLNKKWLEAESKISTISHPFWPYIVGGTGVVLGILAMVLG